MKAFAEQARRRKKLMPSSRLAVFGMSPTVVVKITYTLNRRVFNFFDFKNINNSS